jgi:hypothetical protein
VANSDSQATEVAYWYSGTIEGLRMGVGVPNAWARRSTHDREEGYLNYLEGYSSVLARGGINERCARRPPYNKERRCTKYELQIRIK